MATVFLDRVTGAVAPIWTLRRQRARMALGLLARHYEGAAGGRRTSSWRRSAGDANAVIGPSAARLREHAHDLVRNNPYAESALATIGDHAVGWGIVAKPARPAAAAFDRWQAWSESTACDADGVHDFAGLQKLVMTTVAESGEALVRRRIRRLEDGLPLPLQLQVMEPDLLDQSKTLPLGGGGEIVQGVEFDVLGRRVAFWLFPRHPGSTRSSGASVRIPATDVTQVFKRKRAGQVRGVTWFAPVILRFKDFDEFEDATLMKQKIAACLAVITSDVDGTAPALGLAGTDTGGDGTAEDVDMLSPGAILNIPPGRSVEVVQPPTVSEYEPYAKVNLRAIATGMGVTYEDLTGDYSRLPFSAARMSRLRHWSRVEDWRWRMLIPQFCDPAWRWAMTAAEMLGDTGAAGVPARWTPPPMPMIEPDKEGLAVMRNVRAGIQTLPDALRERGYDLDEFLQEVADTNAELDRLGIMLDSDPRRMTQAGQAQGTKAANTTPPAPPADPPEAEDEDDA